MVVSGGDHLAAVLLVTGCASVVRAVKDQRLAHCPGSIMTEEAGTSLHLGLGATHSGPARSPSQRQPYGALSARKTRQQ